jgi:hypothetical protein
MASEHWELMRQGVQTPWQFNSAGNSPHAFQRASRWPGKVWEASSCRDFEKRPPCTESEDRLYGRNSQIEMPPGQGTRDSVKPCNSSESQKKERLTNPTVMNRLRIQLNSVSQNSVGFPRGPTMSAAAMTTYGPITQLHQRAIRRVDKLIAH